MPELMVPIWIHRRFLLHVTRMLLNHGFSMFRLKSSLIMSKRNRTKWQTMVDKQLPKIEQHEKRDGPLCSGKINSSCFTSKTCSDTLVKHMMISHEWVKEEIVSTTKGTYPCLCVSHIFRNGNQVQNVCFDKILCLCNILYACHIVFVFVFVSVFL
jgi:hypothetical protein